MSLCPSPPLHIEHSKVTHFHSNIFVAVVKIIVKDFEKNRGYTFIACKMWVADFIMIKINCKSKDLSS